MIHFFLAAIAFSIPAGPANVSLERFGDQSGMQILFDWDSMNLVETMPVQGEMDSFAALAILIKDTGISWEYVKERTLSLAPPVPKEMKKEDAVSAMLIAEECQFGRISAARSEALLGYSPGRCWCCTKEEDGQSFCASLLSSVQACSVYDKPINDSGSLPASFKKVARKLTE